MSKKILHQENMAYEVKFSWMSELEVDISDNVTLFIGETLIFEVEVSMDTLS